MLTARFKDIKIALHQKCEENNMEPKEVPYIVYESEQNRNERHIKKLWIALIIAIVLIFASNAVWVYEWFQYDYTGYDYEQNGEGVNIIGNENGVTQNESAFNGEEKN